MPELSGLVKQFLHQVVAGEKLHAVYKAPAYGA